MEIGDIIHVSGSRSFVRVIHIIDTGINLLVLYCSKGIILDSYLFRQLYTKDSEYMMVKDCGDW